MASLRQKRLFASAPGADIRAAKFASCQSSEMIRLVVGVTAPAALARSAQGKASPTPWRYPRSADRSDRRFVP